MKAEDFGHPVLHTEILLMIICPVDDDMMFSQFYVDNPYSEIVLQFVGYLLVNLCPVVPPGVSFCATFQLFVAPAQTFLRHLAAIKIEMSQNIIK